jgi:hypothetical protein
MGEIGDWQAQAKHRKNMAQVNAQTLGLQLEKVRDKVPLLYQQDHSLFDRIMKRDVEKVSSRNMRIPLKILAGGKARQVNPDGGGLGRGSGTTYDVAQATPVYLAFASEMSYLTEISTDSKEKAVENAAKAELENAMEGFRTFVESLLNTDGSGTLDSVVSATGTQIIVNNANAFYDNQDIQIFSGLGGTNRGKVTIQSVDANNKALNLTGNIPTGTTAGDLLIIDGAPGTAASSLFGIEYHHVDSNVGTWMQLQRSTYPGKLDTPHVGAGGSAITPALVRLLIQKQRRALGASTGAKDSMLFHLGLDQEAAWEQVGTVVSQVITNQVTGSSSQDMLKKNAPTTIAGRSTLVSIHAQPGRIDLLAPDHWFRAENRAMDYYDVDGQTIFPTYDTTGGIATSNIFYLFTGMQICMDGPRFGAYLDGLQIPTGY